MSLLSHIGWFWTGTRYFAFTAFKNVYGVSPRAWREQHRWRNGHIWTLPVCPFSFSTAITTSFSNSVFLLLIWILVWVPYIFTSFSNAILAVTARYSFEHHTFLHHSQTSSPFYITEKRFEYHTFLHHSQTVGSSDCTYAGFEYHTFLHHSQTVFVVQLRVC